MIVKCRALYKLGYFLLLYYPQHQLIKALLIFLTLYVANEEFTTCEHQSPVNECQAFETQLTTMT